jgi:RimJ/RimL family protein N-acetyltransferase
VEGPHAENRGRPEALRRIEIGELVGEPVATVDLEDLASLHADPLVARTLSRDGRPIPRDHSQRVLEEQLGHWTEHGFGVWVFREPDGRFVGRAGLKVASVHGEPEVELLYAVTSDRWGRGYATAIAEGLVGVAADHLGLDRLVAFVLPTNTASRRVLEKCGFEPDGTVVHAGLTHDLMRLELEHLRS